jgi:hypothetical protein
VIVLLYFDWFGTAEELKEGEEKLAAVCAEVDGVEYKGRYAPDNRKFHFVYMFEVKSYEKLLEVLTSPEMPPRDYKKLTHGTFEILRGPIK